MAWSCARSGCQDAVGRQLVLMMTRLLNPKTQRWIPLWPPAVIGQNGKSPVPQRLPGRLGGGPVYPTVFIDRMFLRFDLDIPIDGWPVR